jgi:hypothetical protein
MFYHDKNFFISGDFDKIYKTQCLKDMNQILFHTIQFVGCLGYNEG